MNEDLKNIEICLPEDILAEVANVPTDEQFFGVAGYEFISEETILQEMETIMQGLDNDLTAEGAASITAETQTIIH